MGGKDDGVAALQCKCAVAHGGDDGVGGGDDGGDDADGLCHFDHAALFDAVDDVAGLLALQALPDQCGLIAALCNLVLFAAHAGFFCGHGAQLFSVVIYDLADCLCSCVCLFRVVWLLTVVQRWHTLKMLTLSYPISWVLAALVFLVVYLRGNWLSKRIAQCGMEPEVP